MFTFKGDPFLFADWERAVFLNFIISPALLRPQVPPELELDLYEGMGCVSVVALTMRNFRPARPISPGWLFRPIVSQRFLNLRTYVRFRGEPGALFLWGWLSNPVRLSLPFQKVGLPCSFAELEYDHQFERGSLCGSVKSKHEGLFEYRASLDSQFRFEPCPAGSLAEFAMERYTGFFSRGARQRLFRAWHPPWLQRPIQATIGNSQLITNRFRWFEGATLAAANFAPGFPKVWLGRPRALDSKLHDRHAVLSSFYEMP